MAVPSSPSREKLSMRVSTAISGYSVRQSEEAIRNLRKENFNLKLKMFMLESRKGRLSSTPEADEHCDGDYIDLVLENQSMKNELVEKQALLKSSLNVIQSLEEQKLQIELECQELIKEKHLKAVQELTAQQKPKKLRQKKSQVNFTSTSDLRHEQEAKSLRVENSELKERNCELSKKVAELDEKVAEKTKCVEELLEQRTELELRLKEMESKLSGYEDKIMNLNDKLKDKSSSDASEVIAENKKLKQAIEKLTIKCEKLDDSNKDMEKLLREQSGLMKALNRTIEVKNEELAECRIRYESIDLCASTSDLYIPDEVDLTFASAIKTASNSSEFPFYNPLFGAHYENLYR